MPFVKNLGKTNCLTYIPQDIKLNLNSGTLTLKADSKVYIPNGFESYKYYKYVYGSWTRPNLTSNTSDTSFTLSDPKLSGGTIDDSNKMTWGSAAVTRFTDVWKALDNSTSTYFTINNGNKTFTVFDITFSEYMKVTSITIDGNVVSGSASSLTGSQIYSIDDFGSVKLLSTKTNANTNTHTFEVRTKKLRICMRPNSDGSSYPSRITNIAITAQKQTGATESTSTSYDYYVGSNPKFDEVVIKSDLSTTSTADRTCLFFLHNSRAAIDRFPTVWCYSGATAPTGSQYMMWYDTTNNIVKKTSDSGATWGSGVSLPVGLFAEGTSGIKSIDQVFNGFSYIGSTAFSLPGVKGLIPNGRNADGSLKNIEFVTSKVSVVSVGVNQTNYSLVLNSDGLYTLSRYQEVSTPVSGYVNYVASENKIYNGVNQRFWAYVSSYSSDSDGKITSLTPKKIGEGYAENKFYQLVQNGKQYFKYAYRVNTSIVGSPTINNCVVSGFSSSNYLNFPAISIGSEPWEIVFKATTGSSTGNNQGLFGITGTGYTRCDTSNNKLRILLSNSSSSFNIGEIASRTLSANTTYWFKITFTGSSYNMYSSTDGINYTLDQSISSTAKTTFASGMMIGRARDGVWGGSIDLKESYIKINDEVVWDNKFVGTGTSTDYDWTEDKLIYRFPSFLDTFNYKIEQKQTATGTYQFTLDRDFSGKLLFVGNGCGGGSSQKSSYWYTSSGGSGACFEGEVLLPKGTYTLTIGALGYGYNVDNQVNNGYGSDSSDSFLVDEDGNELIRVGCGARGKTAGAGGAGGKLTLGTLQIISTTKAADGNTGGYQTKYGGISQQFAASAYDGTNTGYGAGISSYRGAGNVYGVAGIFKLIIDYQDKGMRGY